MFRFNLWPRPLMPTSSLQPPSMDSAHFLHAPPGALSSLPHNFPLDSFKNATSGCSASEKDSGEKISPVSMTPFGMPVSMLRAPAGGDVTSLSHMHAALLSPLHQHFLRAQLELATSAHAHAHRKDDYSKHLPPLTSSSSAFTPTKRACVSPSEEALTSPRADTSLRNSDASSPAAEGSANRAMTSSFVDSRVCDVSSPSSHVSGASSTREREEGKSPGKF